MDDVTDFLTEEENKKALKHTIDSWNFRNSISEKIGKPHYTLQVYDNLIRAIPFSNNMILIVTMNNGVRPNDIIERIQTILPGHPIKMKEQSMPNNNLINVMKKSFDY